MAKDFAIVVPMANESLEFSEFTEKLSTVFDRLGGGAAYFVIDRVSHDDTLQLSRNLSEKDKRFITVWAPENKNVVDAYIRGYQEAYRNGHAFIIEMDAGLSHDPEQIPDFLAVLEEGKECAFGSRFIKGGRIFDSSFKRWLLSRLGTILSNILLGTKMHDATSGFQGFRRDVVGDFLNYKLLSKAHFYQTELRYLLRKRIWQEVPISYRAPSPSVSKRAITNSFQVLFYYFSLRLKGREKFI